MLLSPRVIASIVLEDDHRAVIIDIDKREELIFVYNRSMVAVINGSVSFGKSIVIASIIFSFSIGKYWINVSKTSKNGTKERKRKKADCEAKAETWSSLYFLRNCLITGI